jgi:ATP-binding cassette subfamily F protein uup
LAIDENGTMHRVPGGVTGWLAERAHRVATKMVSTPAVKKPGRPKADRSGPSPSTIGRRLRETEQAMVKAQRRVDMLAERLAGLNDHQQLVSVGDELVNAQGELDTLEAEWLELAELNEG